MTDTANREKQRTPADIRAPYRERVWRVSPRASLMGAERYSKFVKFMKRALPMAAAALALAVLVYALQSRDMGRLALTFERLGNVEGDLTMIKPRLSGTDENGLPFVVTAASASQEERGSDRVKLDDVVADITLKDGMALHVTAAEGVVDTRTHVLQVSGGIHLVSEDGYDARTASAVADLKSGTMRGEEGIEAQGAFGSIVAERFDLDRETRLLRFSGNVRMLLNSANPLPEENTLPEDVTDTPPQEGTKE